jgi:crossover junction endodeoxyribonuclease RuvC
MRLYVGIDPGLTGALAVVTDQGDLYRVYDLPTIANGKAGAKVKRKLNGAELARILTQLDEQSVNKLRIVVEQVSSMPGQGVASVFSLGQTAGKIEGVLEALGLGYTYVHPKTWKKFYKLLRAEKEHSRALALQTWPLAGAIEFSRKMDQNRAEACLIAKWGITQGGFV